MIAPSQVRYAMEGRPYSEALFFGLLSILALVKLAREKSIGTAILAILAIAAGLYTQTYVIFAIGGAAAWYLRKTVLPMACVVGAAILFRAVVHHEFPAMAHAYAPERVSELSLDACPRP